MKFITIADLKAKNACSEGIRLYKENGYETLDWDSIDELDIDVKYNDYIHWLCWNFNISLKFNGNEYIFDKVNNLIYFENSYGFRSIWQFNKNDNEIYYKDSNGLIIDNREEAKNNVKK